MPIRNPFARRANVQDENARPGASVVTDAPLFVADDQVEDEAQGGDIAHPGFERVDTIGSKASSALSVRSRKSQDTGEYKMSVVNDSGVYLPPSPVEREATWPKRYMSRTSTETRSSSSGLGEIEHFSISRESFDSYRRSFDICAKSPVIVTDPTPPRQSLDSVYFTRMPRSVMMTDRQFEREPPTPEEGFEDVGLNDDGATNGAGGKSQQQQPRRRGFFKFGSEHPHPHDSSAAPNGTAGAQQPAPAMSSMSMARFLPGRKRGHSGQGAELGAIPQQGERPGTAHTITTPVQEQPQQEVQVQS